MRKSARKQKASLTVKLLNILMVIMIIAALVSLIRMVNELRRSFERDPYSGITYDLQDQDYAGMVREYYNRNYDVAPFPSLHEDEYHVAEYTDAAFQRLFFETVGDSERTEFLEAKMKAARDRCGVLSVSADDVDEVLAAIPLCPQG